MAKNEISNLWFEAQNEKKSGNKPRILRDITPINCGSTNDNNIIIYCNQHKLVYKYPKIINKNVKSLYKYKNINGYLKKKSKKFGTWNERWFDLFEDTLYYYKRDSMIPNNIIKIYNIKYIEIGNIKLNERNYKNKIKYSVTNNTINIFMNDNLTNDKLRNRIYVLKTVNITQRNEWINAILNNKSIVINNNTYNSSIDVLNGYTLYQKNIINNNVFKTICETGDIVLFKTDSTRYKLIRKATKGEYDHIGLVLRFQNGRIGLLDAIIDHGVRICLWRDYYHNNGFDIYSKIALRKLNIKDKYMKYDIQNKLILFAKNVVGGKYELNVKSILKQHSLDKTIINNDNNNNDHKMTFFCSQLIGKAFKDVGLLRKDYPSNGYYPSSFQDNSGLILLKGCNFDREIIININKKSTKHE